MRISDWSSDVCSSDLNGAYLSAGILVDVPLEGPLRQDEIFGPIAMVFRAANIDEAIAIANDTPFGLGSSVWTKEKEEQDRFVRDIQAGMTAIKDRKSTRLNSSH